MRTLVVFFSFFFFLLVIFIQIKITVFLKYFTLNKNTIVVLKFWYTVSEHNTEIESIRREEKKTQLTQLWQVACNQDNS